MTQLRVLFGAALAAYAVAPVGGSLLSARTVRSPGQLTAGDAPVVSLPLKKRLDPSQAIAEAKQAAAMEHEHGELVKGEGEGAKAEGGEAEGSKEETKSEGGEEGGEEAGGEHAGFAIACLVFLLMFFASSLFAMAKSSIPRVANNTVLVFDNILAIFFAVLWCSATDDLAEALPHLHHQVFTKVLHAVMLLTLVFGVAWKARANKTTIAILCGCGAHYCAFGSGSASLATQAHFFKDHPLTCLGGFFVLLGALVVVGAGMYRVKKAMGVNPGEESSDEEVNDFVDRFDDVECDAAAMALALYWVMVVQFSLMGEWPEAEIEPGAKPVHSRRDRLMMLAYTAALFVAGPFILMKLSSLGGEGYLKDRLFGLAKSFTAMSCAFAFLTWGKMSFYEHEDTNMSPIFARIVFAAVCTAVAMVGIFAIAAKLPAGAAASACLAALGLIAGFGWEEVFDAAVESAVEGSPHENYAKIGVAAASILIVMPTYVNFVKPSAMEAAEKEEEA